MRFRSLTGLQRDKIQKEYDELLALIADLIDILAKPARGCHYHRRNGRNQA
jgi:DNA gyrase subunit A